MRLIHTADWHLGHQLRGIDRGLEHQDFLDWLVRLVVERQIDALLIAGDVFDTANPPSSALKRYYRFLRDVGVARPGLQVVVIGGNHDSAARLEAPKPLLEALDVAVVGAWPDGELDGLLVPLREVGGEIAAVAVAVPFLRPVDLPPCSEAEDPLVAGVRARYQQALQLAEERFPGLAKIALGHCYLVGTALSELSERRVLGGNQHALPHDLFPEELAYVALGHLHKAQAVGGRERLRYSGSPIPLSMTERDYKHQVVEVELGAEVRWQAHLVPRSVDLRRVPAVRAEVEAALTALEALPEGSGEDRARWPLIEVPIRLDSPVPDLRARVEAALAKKAVRLVRIDAELTGTGAALADQEQAVALQSLSAEEVMRAAWARKHVDPPSEAVMERFHQLVLAVESGEGVA